MSTSTHKAESEPTFLLEGYTSSTEELYYTDTHREIRFVDAEIPAIGKFSYCVVREETEAGIWKIQFHTYGRTRLEAFIEYSNQLAARAVKSLRSQDPLSMTAPDAVRAEDYTPPGVTRLSF